MKFVLRQVFLRDPALILRLAEEYAEPIVIIADDDGRPIAIISVPREEPKSHA